MARFITRVELLDGQPADYEALRGRMAVAGFGETVKDASGKLFMLPTGTYQLAADLTAVQVRDMTAHAAATTGKNAWVLVTAFTEAAWMLNEAPE